MQKDFAQRISESESYQELVKTRTRFGWTLTLIMLGAYLGFLFLVAFQKELMTQPIAEGWTTTVSIPVGIGLIVFTIILTGIYVRRANSKYDALTEKIKKEFQA